MKTSAKAVKKVTLEKKAPPAKKLIITKKDKPVVNASEKPKKLPKPLKAAAAIALDSVDSAPAKAVKTRVKGVDKNYVAPPTVVLVQTSAKLVHTPTSAGLALNPAVIPTPVKKNVKLVNNWKTKNPIELTDAEVIAMPDEEYMNRAQLAFFKHRLSQLRDSVLQNASDTTEHLRDDTAVVPDPTDRATIEEEHALELRTRDRERKLLKKIQQSLGRIEQEDYGYCDETGEPIGVSRLIARPTATLSLEAQQRRELKQKMFGD